jgi:DNA-binding transcriptional MerR regulator
MNPLDDDDSPDLPSYFDMSGAEYVTLGNLAKAVGRSVESLRRWEKLQRIPTAQRDELNNRIWPRHQADAILALARRMKSRTVNPEDHRPVNRPKPWAEVEAEDSSSQISFTALSGTARYEAELNRASALIRSPNYGAASSYRRRPRRSDSLLYEQ